MKEPLSAAAHVIQLALTPIFLLTAVASLLNVFATRLGRISDRMRDLKRDNRHNRYEMQRLRTRSRILDAAVTLAAAAGAMTCCAAITLFFGVLRDSGHAAILFFFFGGGLLCAVAGLGCFVTEITLAGRTLRDEDALNHSVDSIGKARRPADDYHELKGPISETVRINHAGVSVDGSLQL